MELEIFPADPLNPGFGYTVRNMVNGEVVEAYHVSEETALTLRTVIMAVTKQSKAS